MDSLVYLSVFCNIKVLIMIINMSLIDKTGQGEG